MAVTSYAPASIACGTRPIAPLVPRIDDVPGRLGRGSPAQRALGLFAELIVFLEETPVLLGHAPAGELVLLQRGQALALHLLGDVHPQLDDDDPLVVQHPLELH